jgi:hypothetical protein
MSVPTRGVPAERSNETGVNQKDVDRTAAFICESLILYLSIGLSGSQVIGLTR